MNCDQENKANETDCLSGEPANSPHEVSQEPPRKEQFNALEILARFPDLSRDEPVARAKSTRYRTKKPREISLRVLGGSVLAVFFLAIAISYLWNGPDKASSPPKGASASFESDSIRTSKTNAEEPKVTPIAAIESSESETTANDAAPLEPSEFEKALGIVKTDKSVKNPTTNPVQPFLAGKEPVSEKPSAGNPDLTPRRPLAPRFDRTNDSLATTPNSTPWRPEGVSEPTARETTLSPRNEQASTSFTPWQPGVAANQTPVSHDSPNPQMTRPGADSSYSPWPPRPATAPAHSAVTPAPRQPAYTAMNPNPPQARNIPTPANSYQNPSPVWNPGNPYATPSPMSRGVSPARTPYQQ